MSEELAARSVAAAAGVEVATGLVLIIRPPLFGRLLFGAEFSGAGQAIGRLAGISLLALALACWPNGGLRESSQSSLRALLVFSLLTTIYLAYLGIGTALVGPLLWPAVALHLALSILLGHGWLSGSQANG